MLFYMVNVMVKVMVNGQRYLLMVNVNVMVNVMVPNIEFY